MNAKQWYQRRYVLKPNQISQKLHFIIFVSNQVMNSNYGKPGSRNNLDFDLGLGSNRPTSLKDQKNQTTSSFSSYSSTQSKPSWQPYQPSWSHQPASSQPARPGLSNGLASMVGDISGKSWASPPSGSTSSIGIVNKNPNLFGDLVGSVLGQSKDNSNVPLKNATPTSVASGASANKSPYSMGNLSNSLPKTANSVKSSGNWGSTESFGSFTSAPPSNVNANISKGSNVGGPSMRSMSGGGAGGLGGGMSSNKDPFGFLVDFGTKQSSSLNNSASKGTREDDDGFGVFQHASKPSTAAFSSSDFSANNNDFIGSSTGSGSKIDDFGMPTNDFASQNQPHVQSSGADVFDTLFSSTSAPVGGPATTSGGFGVQQPSEVDEWGLDSEFGGGSDMGGTTTELKGLPPPPAGVSAPAAKNKGMDNYKQGQYADAIKWLSWAVVLLEKAGDNAATMEVLSSRASCYKEVGEYKKAVADCTKVLEHDDANVAVLVQRALLYESMEKYRLGAEDLRTVLKIDPGNRIARSTVHRLAKMPE